MAAALAACSPPTPAAKPPAVVTAEPAGQPQTGLEERVLTIRSGSKVHRLTVEVARSPAEQQIGMMWRRSLAADRGMLFPYAQPEYLAFWMKNTLIPLDLVFIRADGTIARIADNAEPLSLDRIDAGEPVSAVLEIAGGRAAELGIAPGDRVEW